MERIYYIHESVIRRSLQAAKGLVDYIYVAEDLGTQNSLLMSPAAFRCFIKPWLRKMIDLAHSLESKSFIMMTARYVLSCPILLTSALMY